MPPLVRRQRFHLQPGDIDLRETYPLSLRLSGGKRFILVTFGGDEEYPIAVADAAGLIPVFDSREEARSYAARHGLDPFADAPNTLLLRITRALHERVNAGSADLDAAADWAADPATGDAGPVTIRNAWRVLAMADAAPEPHEFDPMGLMALESGGGHDLDGATHSVLTTGMRLAALLQWPPADRAVGPVDEEVLVDTLLWNANHTAVAAAILRRGIPDLASRLSRDAARRDVTQTWSKPVPALSVALRSGSGTDDDALDIVMWRGIRPTEDSIAMQARRLMPPLPPREKVRVSDEAYARYLADRERYEEELRAYLRVDRDHSDAAHRSIEGRAVVRNAGRGDAEDLTLRWLVPHGLEVVSHDAETWSPHRPDTLLAPMAYEDPAARREPYVAQTMPAEGRSDRIRQVVKRAPDGGWIVEERLLGYSESFDHRTLKIRFPDWESVSGFELRVEVVAGDSVVESDTESIRPRVVPD